MLNHATNSNFSHEAIQEIKRLKNTIVNIDALQQITFTEIAAAVSLARYALTNPATYKNPEYLATLLMSIKYRCDSTINDINSEAEQHGAHSKDGKDDEFTCAIYAASRCAGGAK